MARTLGERRSEIETSGAYIWPLTVNFLPWPCLDPLLPRLLFIPLPYDSYAPPSPNEQETLFLIRRCVPPRSRDDGLPPSIASPSLLQLVLPLSHPFSFLDSLHIFMRGPCHLQHDVDRRLCGLSPHRLN